MEDLADAVQNKKDWLIELMSKTNDNYTGSDEKDKKEQAKMWTKQYIGTVCHESLWRRMYPAYITANERRKK